MTNYMVGDTITQSLFGIRRLVKVIAKQPCINNKALPGFEGYLLDGSCQPVWGFDTEVVDPSPLEQLADCAE